MRQALRTVALAILAAVGLTTVAHGHSPYGKALKEHHELKSVTCYACHLKGKDEKTGKPLGKEHLNEFGETLHKVLKDKKITDRIEAAKQEGPEERKKINLLAEEEFLKAYETIQGKTSSQGKSWQDQITAGEQEGIKLKK